jgi:IclR family acetate operon transcriptional repressor
MELTPRPAAKAASRGKAPTGTQAIDRASASTTRTSRLAAQFAEIRRSGYGVAVEELEPGLIAIAAPVRGRGGQVIAAISVSGPSIRLGAAQIAEIGALLVSEADAFSASLGTPQ